MRFCVVAALCVAIVACATGRSAPNGLPSEPDHATGASADTGHNCVAERHARRAAEEAERLADSLAGKPPPASTAVNDSVPLTPPRFVKDGHVIIPKALRRVRAYANTVLVLDTVGRVIPCSIEMLTLTDPRFDSLVRVRLVRARYAPGMINGVPVPTLVRQAMWFIPER